MEEKLCEVRLDIPLPGDCTPRRFETAWRKTLAAQKMTALAMPPACAVAARFRVCDFSGEHPSPLSSYLIGRLSALPGSPAVAAETPLASSDWRGVKIWLSFRAADLPALLRPVKPKISPIFMRGYRS